MISHTGRIHQLLFPSLVWKMDSPNIFLTFDDGPHPVATPTVLNILKSYDIKATFFLSGNAVGANQSIVKEMATEGHSLGIHAYNHIRAIAFSKRETMHEIRRTQEEIENIVPLRSRLFRPPFGFFSWNTISAARAQNYKLIMWTTLTGDFRSNWSNGRIVATALTKLTSGSILVFHDNELTKSRISKILPETITRIQDLGFTFQAIS
jgi:peptidoglycan/xylan/chitin deacetylase (PgdA/CDA1 family)